VTDIAKAALPERTDVVYFTKELRAGQHERAALRSSDLNRTIVWPDIAQFHRSGRTSHEWSIRQLLSKDALVARRMGAMDLVATVRILLGSRHDAATGETRDSRSNMLASLAALRGDAAQPNWDGEGSAPIAKDAALEAEKVIRALPAEWPEGDIGVDPDGEVSITWHGGVGHVLKISIGRDGKMAYAGAFGQARASGREHFGGEIPSAILAAFARLDGSPIVEA
jgi:hypothetical protein